MGKIILILGGARSGKSTYAIKLAKGTNKKVAFIATCSGLDNEMKKRIQVHKKKRPLHWQTFEEDQDPACLLKKICSIFDIVIIDCLTLLISNLLLKGAEDNIIEDKVNKILKIIKSTRCNSVIVSNEVGLGIVPHNRLGRRFRDLAGRINQNVARRANVVFFMVSGMPLKVK